MSKIFRGNIWDDKVKDSITLEKVEKEPDSYTLPEFNERQEGVANWFKQMGSLDLKAPMEFPEGFHSARDHMEEMSKDPDFPKKWMFGMAMLLKKGLHINMIPDLTQWQATGVSLTEF